MDRIKILEKRPPKKGLLNLSVSKIKTFQDCKKRFHFQYVQKIPQEDTAILLFGKFLHLILELFHAERIKGNELPDSVLMTNVYKEAKKKYALKVSGEQIKESKEIINNYLSFLKKERENKEAAKILSVEKEFFIEIDEKILLNGFIDRVQQDYDGLIHVADYKTSASSKYLKKDFLQLKTYGWIQSLVNPEIDNVRCSYVMLRNNFEFITKEFSKNDLSSMSDLFLKFADQINSEKLYRPCVTPLCGWCPYKNMCPEGQDFLGIVKPDSFGERDWI